MNIQNIETKRKGLKCKIRVINHTGDSTLTTFDPVVDNSVSIATADLQDFVSECIKSFKGRTLKPVVAGRRIGATEYDLIQGTELLAPEFDLGIFDDVIVQPVPLVGG
jgi:hypothetical protein